MCIFMRIHHGYFYYSMVALTSWWRPTHVVLQPVLNAIFNEYYDYVYTLHFHYISHIFILPLAASSSDIHFPDSKLDLVYPARDIIRSVFEHDQDKVIELLAKLKKKSTSLIDIAEALCSIHTLEGSVSMFTFYLLLKIQSRLKLLVY